MIKEQIFALIKELGPDKAATVFGKKAGTVKQWIKTKSLPGDAYEAYAAYRSQDIGPEPVAPTLPPPEGVSMVVPPQPQTEPVTHEDRILALEHFARQVTAYFNQQPAQPQGIQVQGTLPPNSLPFNMPWMESTIGAPGEANFNSLIRPGANVPSKATYTDTTPRTVVVKPAGLQGKEPSDLWMKPIPKKQ
jgi:hypothetical protein